MTSGLALKVVVACAFATLSLYCLMTGRRDNDVKRLMLAVVCGILTAVVFGL